MFTDITSKQYVLFRALFGIYLTVHFSYLFFYGAELFAAGGMVAEGTMSPIFAFAPSVLHISDAAWFVQVVIGCGVVAALLFTAGRYDRIAALWMLWLLISLFARNPLIANPALPYVGFMLLLHAFVPKVSSLQQDGARWRLPQPLFWAAVVVLALSYSYSGWTKLFSPGWVAGDTVAYVLENPLARDWWVRDLVMMVPDGVLAALTWFILYVELFFAPLYLIKRLQPWLWGGMLFVQIGFLLILRFPDLTIPMLLMHLLTMNPAWIRSRPIAGVLHYDGQCGVCHKAVQFALTELGSGLKFRPVQRDGEGVAVSTWSLEADGRTYERSDAGLRLLLAGSGIWPLLARVGYVIPRRLRDGTYDVVARYRRRFLKQPEALCPLVSPELRERFV